MEDLFKNLQKDGKNTVDNLIKWMKDSKIIDGKTETEEKARKLFDDVSDAKNVELSKFKAALSKLATEQQKSVEGLMKTLADEGPKFLNAAAEAASAAASAFKDALKFK
ncbi:unnamed protein product [Leptosia nina]|uniref:Uncharacterized protein n=1 Tax=Leptosia nina TaxID=320188 RepID=A0AAV1JB46_9NEOP